ncbi:MAG: ATP-binding protein, partial [Acidimicrobiales bacterium]
GLRPWRDVIQPHDDVARGKFALAEFAADLHQVWLGEGAAEYADPVEFFRRTFLTGGLRQLLAQAVERLSGQGGSPVVDLQTSFGGGKTHSMIALYHLAAGYPPQELPGIEGMLADAELEAPPVARTAVLVGQWLSPASIADKGDGVSVRTLWGEMAWQLGGAEGYALVADADRAGTSPGAAVIELLRRFSPCLVLIDEWVAYARLLYGVEGLPAGSFDAQFTFAQALAEAARAVPGALLVVSIPASDIEVGGEGGRAALERLKNVIGRVESSWRPASADEGFEIVRRRLFDDIPAALAPQRDAVVRAFANLYRTQRGEFPPGCTEGDYERRLTAAYPIHPELFDRLYGEWSTLEKFQRTRGVLRLMAAVVHELWERNDSGLLVLPASVPIDADRVRSELVRYLDDGWEPVLGTDVDGPNALPLRLDRENPNLGRYSATRRVARAIYLGSAPNQRAANRGTDDRSIKLACVQPGESPATFGDALRRLTDAATYLYVDGQRYWYSLQPSVTRLAQDRAASHFSDDDVDSEIRRRLAAATRAGARGDFATVHPAPRSPAEVPDEAEVRLVVLGPEHPHSAKTVDSPARLAAADLLERRAAGDRLHRNMLVFLAADNTRLEELNQGVRQYLAWASIESETETLNLDNFQRRQAETRRSHLDDAVAQRIGETFIWVLVPTQTAADPTVGWEEIRVSGPEPLAVRVGRKLAAEEALITAYSGVRLRMDLDRVPLWRGDHVGLRQLWSDFSQYLYLPRLRNSAVLVDAVRSGVALLTWSSDTFAYASAFEPAGDGAGAADPGGDGDGGTGRYAGLVAGHHADVVFDAAAVVVRPTVASRRIESDRRPAAGVALSEAVAGSAAGVPPPAASAAGMPAVANDGIAAVRPIRFYGRVSLAPVRMVRDLGDIAEAIVAQLARAGAEVTITVEVEATAPKGLGDDVRRTVSENARTLKFEHHEFEE